jgi:hypothetical protein
VRTRSPSLDFKGGTSTSNDKESLMSNPPDHAFFENDKGQFEPHPLLGNGARRTFKLYRTEFPAIFRFDGKFFQEEYAIDTMEQKWIEITPETAERWLKSKEAPL